MATTQEKLASSLKILKSFHDQHQFVIELSTAPTLTRAHRERLVKAGFLVPIMQGWFLTNSPTDQPGESTAWYMHREAFVAAYATSRFGRDWQLSPEQSLLKHTGHTSLSQQLVIHAPAANNQKQELPYSCSIWMSRCTAAALSPRRQADKGGLILIPLEEALIRVGPRFFVSESFSAGLAVRLADISTLISGLLAGEHSVVAGRLAGALRAVGRDDDANQLLATMRAADFIVIEENPFERSLIQIGNRTNESPYVLRIRAMWADMREVVIERFTAIPRSTTIEVESLMKDIAARYVADAYHSLSIEGYRVSTELIEKVQRNDWSPLTSENDRHVRDAMAAKGYFEAHTVVTHLIRQVVVGNENPGRTLQKSFSFWYLALFRPSVQAGILQAADLAGYRANPVYIRNALHVPPSPEAVRDCMPALFELLSTEDHPGVRAVLGHFIFVFIHPYMDGNGRLSRFLMNFMLVTGGYPWTLVTVQTRNAYLAALEQASTYGRIGPFVDLLCTLIEDQAALPVERISQRPEKGNWQMGVPTVRHS